MNLRIGVIGDSISSRNNGCTSQSWPELLDSLIKSLGVYNIDVRGYAIPGLGWKTAHVATDGYLIGKRLPPVAAAIEDGCSMLIVCLGANDRQNPNAVAEALAMKAAMPSVPIHLVQQSMYDSNGVNDCIVTLQEQQAMDTVYAALGWDGYAVKLWKLYDMEYTYDHLHPNDSGKTWIASSTYMYLQDILPLTQISRNVAWLWNQTPEVREQMRKANS